MKCALWLASLAVLVATPAYADWEGRLESSGATFAYPLMDLWRVLYGELHPEVDFNYNSIGSGGGVRNHIERLSHFGVTEAPLDDTEAAAAPGTITIPAMIGSVAVSYNLEGVPAGLNLTASALCGIFLGEITHWSDASIADANPGMSLPDESIITVHRSDGSGTTYAFTSYLTKTCPEWDERIGAAKSVPWPTGVGLPGNEGVAGGILTTDNSMGYVSLAYVLQNDMTSASLENGDGTAFVAPTIESSSVASAEVASSLPAADQSWHGVDMLAVPGQNSYPITSFSYIILHSDLAGSAANMAEAKAIIDIISWMITEGQAYASELGYVPIKQSVTDIGLDGLRSVTYEGEPLYEEPAIRSVPSWVKNTAGWWAEDTITDSEFVNAMKYLISEGIIVVGASEDAGSSAIPDWVKEIAGWWANDMIPDESFLDAIEFLIRAGVLVV